MSSKQILGDNPFAPKGEASEPPRDEQAPATDASASPTASPDPGEQGAGEHGAGEHGADAPAGARGRRAQTVPDAASFDDGDDNVFADEEEYWGGEAAVPPGDYGPPIPSVLPNARSVANEVRELERRVRARLTPAFPIENRRLLPLAWLWKRYRSFAMRDRSDVVDEFGRDPVAADRIEPLIDFLYRRYFRVDCQGAGRVPPGGPVILVANHSGTLPYDGAILMHAVRREIGRDVRPLVEDFVFHFPYLGTFINRIGGVRACQENARRLLDDDQVVAVFPEGIKGIGKTYRDRYKLQRFGRGGFIKLALRTGATVVPVSIVGAEEIHPMLGKVTWFSRSLKLPYIPITPTFPLLGPLGAIPLPSKWFIRFGQPMFLDDYGPSDAEDRILVNQLSEGVRSQLQSMIDDTLAQRESVIFG